MDTQILSTLTTSTLKIMCKINFSITIYHSKLIVQKFIRHNCPMACFRCPLHLLVNVNLSTAFERTLVMLRALYKLAGLIIMYNFYTRQCPPIFTKNKTPRYFTISILIPRVNLPQHLFSQIMYSLL